MNASIPFAVGPRQLRRATWLLLTLWTLVVAASAVWNVRLLHEAMFDAATQDARNSYDQDVLYLLNPAYMTRQVHELGQRYGARGHITSLKPLRPENAPDAWETAALRAFEQGQAEALAPELYNGQPHLRFMRPLVVKAGCLKCHTAHDGYREGSIRGGISLAVPLAPYEALAHARIGPIAGAHAGLWALGVLGIFLTSRQMRQRLDQQAQAAEALRDSEALYHSLVSHLPQCVLRKDLDGRFTFANQNVCRLWGKTPAEIQGLTDFDCCPRELAEKYRQDDQRVMQAGRMWEEVEENSLPNGERIFVHVVKTPLINAAGKVVGVQVIFWDITARKQTEAERERLIVELQHTLAELKTLQGIIPICSGCKKIRDDQGYWSQVETYVAKHSKAKFSHGLCPDCVKKWEANEPLEPEQ